MSSPPPIDISPPLYDPYDTESCPASGHSPTYSERAVHSEVSLMQESVDCSAFQSNNALHWTFETKHMKIYIGPQLWSSSYPTYGLNAKIEGSITLSIPKDHVDKVTVELVLTFSSCVPTANGAYVVTVPLQSVSLYDSATDFAQWRDEIPFSVTIPSTIKLNGEEALAPPTFNCNHYAASCQLNYSLKASLAKKKSTLRKVESKTIPIHYLPKSSPREPQLNSIPRPPGLHSVAVSPSYLHSFDRVLTSTLSPFWPAGVHPNPNVKLSSFQNCINFSLPIPSVFASGSSIPFAISVCCPDQPALSAILLDRIRIALCRRVSITSHMKKRVESGSGPKKDHEYVPVKVYGECPVKTGHLRYKNDYEEGTTLYRGYITAGSTGKESSFRIPGMLDVEYIIRVMIGPPDYMLEHVPSFSHDFTIDLTTDHWGTVDRELAATGGMPTPALGLVNLSARDDEYVSGWGWTM